MTIDQHYTNQLSDHLAKVDRAERRQMRIDDHAWNMRNDDEAIEESIELALENDEFCVKWYAELSRLYRASYAKSEDNLLEYAQGIDTLIMQAVWQKAEKDIDGELV